MLLFLFCLMRDYFFLDGMLAFVGVFRSIALGGCPWALQLVTDGYTLSGTDELWQVGVQGMVWESSHLYGLTV